MPRNNSVVTDQLDQLPYCHVLSSNSFHRGSSQAAKQYWPVPTNFWDQRTKGKNDLYPRTHDLHPVLGCVGNHYRGFVPAMRGGWRMGGQEGKKKGGKAQDGLGTGGRLSGLFLDQSLGIKEIEGERRGNRGRGIQQSKREVWRLRPCER